MRFLPVALVSGALFGAVFAFGEITHRRASWSEVGTGHRPSRVEAIVVLGYRNAGARANHLNRYRMRAAIRSIDPRAWESVLVICGGAVAGSIAEADLMERFARDELGYAGRVVLDRTSTTTWENIENAIPLIEDADSITIVSNSIHAQKARLYLRSMRPDLARRLSRGGDHRLGELPFVKPVAALLGLPDLRRAYAALSNRDGLSAVG